MEEKRYLIPWLATYLILIILFPLLIGGNFLGAELWKVALSFASILVLLIYEFLFLEKCLVKTSQSQRHIIVSRIEGFNPQNQEDRILLKIDTAMTSLSRFVAIDFTLIVFLLGFTFVSGTTIGVNFNTIIVFFSILCLFGSGVVAVAALNLYDSAADPSTGLQEKWKIRISNLRPYTLTYQFLSIGVIASFSLLNPVLTGLGCIIYIMCRGHFRKLTIDTLK